MGIKKILEPVYRKISEAARHSYKTIKYEFDNEIDTQLIDDAVKQLKFEDGFNVIHDTNRLITISWEVKR